MKWQCLFLFKPYDHLLDLICSYRDVLQTEQQNETKKNYNHKQNEKDISGF